MTTSETLSLVLGFAGVVVLAWLLNLWPWRRRHGSHHGRGPRHAR